jgi:Raf kinase inhibitor-like YbhB/YbcL family protein
VSRSTPAPATRWAAARALGLALALALASLRCGAAGGAPSPPPGVNVASITVSSTSFTSHGPIPVEHTCDGKDLAPALAWSAPPPGTRALVVIVDDPEAPSGNFTHFVAFDIPPDVVTLKEGWTPAAIGAKAGRNDFDSLDYRGPCPPQREQHMYAFEVFALDKPIDLPEGAARSEIAARMSSHVLGSGALRGSFGH